MEFDEDQLIEIIQVLEEQLSKTQTPVIARNCERTIQIYNNQLNEIRSKAAIPASNGGRL